MKLEVFQAMRITEAEVLSFAVKLEAWYETLPAGEQAVLERLLACAEGAASEDGEVEGYALEGIGARLTRLLAAGVIGTTLAAPLAAPPAASAAASAASGLVKVGLPMVTLSPQDLIQSKAAALGAGFTGSAVSGLESVPGGYRIRYQNCDIYYSQSTGRVCEVHGGIRLKYNYLGGPASALGLPQCDESGFSDGKGRYNVFANNNSAIVWHPTTGPMVIQGAIHWQWVNAGSDTGPLGYPTSDEIALGSGAAYSDFQNGVLYWNGSKLLGEQELDDADVTASLSAQSVATMLRSYIQREFSDSASGRHDFSIDSFSILGVSNTGYDVWHSRSRVITVRVEGSYELSPSVDYTMDMRLLLYANKEADGSTSLRVRAVDSSGVTAGAGDVERATLLLHNFEQNFRGGLYLTRLAVPAVMNVLSFKVLPDGGIKLYLQPGPLVGLVGLAFQREFDRLAQ